MRGWVWDVVSLGCIWDTHVGRPSQSEIWVGEMSLGVVRTAEFLRTWAEFFEAKVAREQSQSGCLVVSSLQKLMGKLHSLRG